MIKSEPAVPGETHQDLRARVRRNHDIRLVQDLAYEERQKAKRHLYGLLAEWCVSYGWSPITWYNLGINSQGESK